MCSRPGRRPSFFTFTEDREWFKIISVRLIGRNNKEENDAMIKLNEGWVRVNRWTKTDTDLLFLHLSLWDCSHGTALLCWMNNVLARRFVKKRKKKRHQETEVMSRSFSTQHNESCSRHEYAKREKKGNRITIYIFRKFRNWKCIKIINDSLP